MESTALSHVPAVFCFESSHEVRTILREDKPWFVGNDVATALGYVDCKQAIHSHCKRAILLKGVESTPLTNSPRGITIIPEGDVFRLIVRSNLPAAEKFECWLMDEVLPTIRKTGSYSAPVVPPVKETIAIEDKTTTSELVNKIHKSVPVEAVAVFDSFYSLSVKIGFDSHQSMLSANMATATLTGIDPLHLMGVTVSGVGRQNIHYTPTELGERYCMTGREFNIALEAAGLQSKHGLQWMPTTKGRAYAVLLDLQKRRRGEGTPVQQLKWTADVLDAMPTLLGGAI